MDWNLAIERNCDALKRVVATLAAMAGLRTPEISQQSTAGNTSPTPAAALPTLPRYLRNAVLRLLRPAESAMRRLIIVAARELVAPPPPKGKLELRKPAPPKYVLSIITLHAGIRSRLAWKAGQQFPTVTALPERSPCTRLVFPLLDRLRQAGPRQRFVSNRDAPRLWAVGMAEPAPRAPLPAADDMLDAARLGLRLAALGAALDDLPGQARRFARWRARRDRSIAREKEVAAERASTSISTRRAKRSRLSPLRFGRPPGARKDSDHEVHEILRDLHYFACEAQKPPDT